MDASKAFDRVNHGTLFKKLVDRKVPVSIVKMLASWYSVQKYHIRWNGILSDGFHVSNGVRQGGILSPFFFNVYMHDLDVSLTTRNVGCGINGVLINHLLYADDLCLICPSVKCLQLLIDHCCEYAKNHDIIFNCDKTVCMSFMSKRFKLLNPPHVTLSGGALKFVESVKYLGCYLQSDLSDNLDIKNHVKLFCIRSNSIIRKFRPCSTSVKSHLFRSFCGTFYGMPLWCNFNKATIDRMRVCYNNGFRILHGLEWRCSASQMFVKDNVRSFGEIHRRVAYSFLKSIATHSNSLIRLTSSGSFALRSRLQTCLRKLVYLCMT